MCLNQIKLQFSNENIMSDIPILEIDCDVEFHDDEAIKKRMLDQVDILSLFWLNINFQIRCEISSRSCRRRNAPRLRRKLKSWTTRASHARQRPRRRAANRSARSRLPILRRITRRMYRRVVVSTSSCVREQRQRHEKHFRPKTTSNNTRLVISYFILNCLNNNKTNS